MEISDKEKSRIQETLAMIPLDVVSILNVGCGDGRVTNSISKKYMITGVDIDKKRLKSCLGTKIIADVSKLPFENSEFDLVITTEVLEHIPESIYLQGIKEICRVSKRYILITVPFQEPLAAQWIKCSECRHVFNAWGHLRKFNLQNIKKLFSCVYLQKTVFFSPKETILPNWLHAITRTVGNIWDYNQKDDSKCPKCGAAPVNTNGNILGWFLIRILWRLQKVWPFRKQIWVGVLFCKTY